MGNIHQPLEEWRVGVEAARALPAGAVRAAALIELAERRAVLHHGGAKVKALLLEAATEVEGDQLLEARCMLRLGQVALAEGAFDAADGHLSGAVDRFRGADYFPGVFVSTATAARLLVRQNQRDAAKGLLDSLAQDFVATGEALGPRAGVALSLALGEWSLEDPEDPTTAAPHFEAVRKAIAAARIVDDDARLAALEGLAALRQARDEGRRAASYLREAFALCQSYESIEDTLRVRLNLGLALVSNFEPGPRGEGHRHLQIVVDEARDHGLDQLRLPALMGLVGVYMHKGAIDGALDRVLEIARGAVEAGNVPLYSSAVALMAEVYTSKQEYTQAFLALIKGRGALKLTVSEEAAKMIDPHIDALAERMGQPRFDAMCRNVVAAQEARKQWKRDQRP